jgi:hypothetical protein
LRIRRTFTLSEKLLREITDFRWRNHIPSLSQALELILTRALDVSSQVTVHQEDDAVQAEREINNKAYRQIKATLVHEKQGSFVVIANGSLLACAGTLEDAYSILRQKVPTARHAIIDRIDEKLQAEAVWEAIGERIS